jgi:hypothetical protein
MDGNAAGQFHDALRFHSRRDQSGDMRPNRAGSFGNLGDQQILIKTIEKATITWTTVDGTSHAIRGEKHLAWRNTYRSRHEVPGIPAPHLRIVSTATATGRGCSPRG